MSGGPSQSKDHENPIAALGMDEPMTLDRARLYLFYYGGHYPACSKEPCTCGFNAVWKHARLPKNVKEILDHFAQRAKT